MNEFDIVNMAHRINLNIKVVVINKILAEYLTERLKEPKLIGKAQIVNKHDINFFQHLIR